MISGAGVSVGISEIVGNTVTVGRVTFASGLIIPIMSDDLVTKMTTPATIINTTK